ncbi:unnamed protein product [Mytilus coruscus]|uniref:Uncharacterized protein n=1 Tax=Mytilus coruscus TaxID=42192 RepID=A0A6J8CW15_MYTCO|nr:unnamed protein product [Mytilus coruscus]
MMGKTDGDWRKGCFAISISSIRISIYQIEQCISELLNVNEQLIDAAANTNKKASGRYFCRNYSRINHKPKKTNPEIANLRTYIEAYRQKRVHLIAEISSIKAIPCNHPEVLDSRRNSHACDTANSVITKIVEICHKVAYSSIGIIQRCYTLLAQMAIEVLVFMLCDLDRMSKPELPHAFPIRYGLKGYSMKTEAMRQMLHDVFLCLFQMGLYTPAISYDGQWAKLSNQDANGKPFTLLGLQKHVYNNVKLTVVQLTRKIFEAGLVNDVDKDSVEDKVEMRKDADIGLFVGHIGDIGLFKTYRSTADNISVLKQNLDAVVPEDSGVNCPASEFKHAEVQLSTASVSNETIGGDYTGGTEQAMDESCETVESGDGLDLYAQFIKATGVTNNDLLDNLISKDRKTKVTKDNFFAVL